MYGWSHGRACGEISCRLSSVQQRTYTCTRFVTGTSEKEPHPCLVASCSFIHASLQRSFGHHPLHHHPPTPLLDTKAGRKHGRPENGEWLLAWAGQAEETVGGFPLTTAGMWPKDLRGPTTSHMCNVCLRLLHPTGHIVNWLSMVNDS